MPWGFPDSEAEKNLPADAGDTSSISGAGRFPWSKKLQCAPVFLPGKFHGQRSLAGCGPWGHKESDVTEHTAPFTCHLCHILLAKANLKARPSLGDVE